MASSKLMAPTSPTNPDLPRQSSSIHPFRVADLHCDQSSNFGSMNMDELLKNICGDAKAFHPDDDGVSGGATGGGGESVSSDVGNRTSDEVWKEIVAGNGGSRDPVMTLEDYLTEAGVVMVEDVQIPAMLPPQQGFVVDSMMNSAQIQPSPHMQSSENGEGSFVADSVGFGNAIDGRMVAIGASDSCGAVGKGKRRLVEEPLDKATQQRQRRMIKNRESAARSRERKQAYNNELEAMVEQLEEDNARLLREEAEQTKERFKKLMEGLIPVVEKPIRAAPRRVLRRSNSTRW